MIKLPSATQQFPYSRGWMQTNRSDIFGSLVGTFNADLNSNVGKVRGTRLLQTSSQNGTYGLSADSNMTSHPAAFKLYNKSGVISIWTVAGSRIHVTAGNASNSAFTVDSTSGTPTTCDSTASDLEVFNGFLYATTYTGGGDALYKLNSTWSANGTGLGATSGTHMMTVYANRLYISRGNNTIYSMNTSDTIATSSSNTLTLDSQYYVTFLRASSNRIWVGTVNPTGKAYIFEWDGAATTATRSYRMESNGALACVIKDDVPYVMDSNGKLLVYSSGTFKEVARLPLRQKYLYNATDTVNDRFIHPNGMTIIDGRINLLINNRVNDSDSSIIEFAPSGIWEFDDLTSSLYHKYSFSYTPVNTTTIYDYGQNRVSSVGALSDMKTSNTASNATGNLLAGGVIYTDASATDAGVFTNDTIEALSGTYQSVQRFLQLITTKFSSDKIQDLWRKVFVKYRQLRDVTDKITVKYRTTEADPVDISITWTSTTTFTTSTNMLSYYNYDTAQGYEVEIVQGTGSGKTAHITQIDVSGLTYTVTLDETFTGATGTAKARLQNWTKVPEPIVSDTTSTQNDFSISRAANWCQVKVCFICKDRDEIEEIIMVNTTQQDAS